MGAIVVHGGAGKWKREKLKDVKEVLKESALKGAELLRSGKVVDACEEAVKVLEDSGLFNAGRGSVRNSRGEVEMDASIMVSDGRAGAVGAVKGVKNPISLARWVMEKTKHTLIVGLEGNLELEGSEAVSGDTVGCVVTDGRLVVAGTSTGGIKGKLPGRVGDSAVIGAGTYAWGRGGASATGDGDEIIKVCLSFFVVSLIDLGLSPMKACEAGIDLLFRRTKGKGGVVALDLEGNLGYAYNTKSMPVCYVGPDGKPSLLGFEVEEETEEGNEGHESR